MRAALSALLLLLLRSEADARPLHPDATLRARSSPQLSLATCGAAGTASQTFAFNAANSSILLVANAFCIDILAYGTSPGSEAYSAPCHHEDVDPAHQNQEFAPPLLAPPLSDSDEVDALLRLLQTRGSHGSRPPPPGFAAAAPVAAAQPAPEAPPAAAAPPAGAAASPLNDSKCAICWERPNDFCCFPCAHLCLCRVCSEVLVARSAKSHDGWAGAAPRQSGGATVSGTVCPICRADVALIVEIHNAGHA